MREVAGQEQTLSPALVPAWVWKRCDMCVRVCVCVCVCMCVYVCVCVCASCECACARVSVFVGVRLWACGLS